MRRKTVQPFSSTTLPTPLNPQSVLTDRKQILNQALPLHIPVVPETVHIGDDPVVQDFGQALQVLHREDDGHGPVFREDVRDEDDVRDEIDVRGEEDVRDEADVRDEDGVHDANVPNPAVVRNEDVDAVARRRTTRLTETINYKNLHQFGTK